MRIKYFFIILMFWFHLSNLYSQNSIVDTVKTYSVVPLSMWGSGTSSYYKITTDKYMLDNDTFYLVEKKIYEDSLWSSTNFYLSEHSETITFIKVDNDTVSRKGVLYDFTLNVGDTAYFSNSSGYYCDSIEMVLDKIEPITLYDGSIRQKFTYLPADYPDTYIEGFTAIKGIGSTNGLLSTFSCATDVGTLLLCVDSADVKIYQDSSPISDGECFKLAESESIEDLIKKASIKIINRNLYISSEEFIHNVHLVSITGKLLYSQVINQKKIQLPLSNVGIMLLHIQYTNGNIETQKIVYIPK